MSLSEHQPSVINGMHVPTHLSRGPHAADLALGVAARGAALIVVLMLVTLLAVLGRAAAPSAATFGPSFVTSTEWRANEIERPRKDPQGHVVIEDGGVA